eukprot:115917_1
MSFYPTFRKLSSELMAKCPFTSFYSEKQKDTEEKVLENINNRIIMVLDEVTNGNMAMDVAFIEINVLVRYASVNVNATFNPNHANGYPGMLYTSYYEFLFHFLIFGPFGARYAQYIALDRHDASYRNNRVLRYCIDEFIPKLDPRHIRYKHNQSQRNAIIDGVQRCLHGNNVEYNIGELIADFTAHPFEEFVFETIVFTMHWGQTEDDSCFQLIEFCTFHGLNSYIQFLIPKLLLSKQFISIHDESLEYFANEMMFKSMSMAHLECHPQMIAKMYRHSMTLQPWTNAMAFIELLEQSKDADGNGEYIINVIEKCVNVQGNHEPLSIFYNGNNEAIVTDISNVMMAIYDNIDPLFTHFIRKYCMQNKSVMNNLLYQMINSLICLEANTDEKHNELKDKLVTKLRHYLRVHLFQNIDYDRFMADPKYHQSLRELQQISTEYHHFGTKRFVSSKRIFNDDQPATHQPFKRRRLNNGNPL